MYYYEKKNRKYKGLTCTIVVDLYLNFERAFNGKEAFLKHLSSCSYKLNSLN